MLLCLKGKDECMETDHAIGTCFYDFKIKVDNM